MLRSCFPAALFALTVWGAAPAAAQEQAPRGYIRATAGYALQYLDEPWQSAIGGSIRLYLTRRLSLEPEFMASPGARFQQWSFIPNVSLDLGRPGRRVTPYVIGGIGYFHELDKSIHYRRSELAWNGGIGTRVLLSGRVFVAPEFRIGHVTRAAVSAGWMF